MKLNSLFIVLFAVVLISTSAFAQNKIGFGGAGFFNLGYTNMNTSALSNKLGSEWPNFSNNGIYIGGSGYGVLGNIVLGGSGGTSYFEVGNTFDSRLTGQTHRYNINGASGEFTVGYVAWQRSKYFLYPYLGIGGYMLNLSWHDRRAENYRDGSSMLTNFGGKVAIDCFTTTLGISLDYVWGLAWQVKAGYRIGLPSDRWIYLDNTNMSNAPSVGQNGFFITLGIGGGGIGFTSKKSKEDNKEKVEEGK